LTPTQQQQLKQLKADLEALKELERQQTQQQRDEHQAQLKAFQASLQKGQALSPDELQTLNLIRQQQRIMSQRLALSMKELLLPLSGMLSEAQKNTLKAHMKAMAEQKGRWFTKKDRPKPRHWARLLMSDAFQAAL
jgi:acetyl-CoA carboxylase alpha subunit